MTVLFPPLLEAPLVIVIQRLLLNAVQDPLDGRLTVTLPCPPAAGNAEEEGLNGGPAGAVPDCVTGSDRPATESEPEREEVELLA